MTDCAVGGERHNHANPVVCTDCHLRTAVNLDWIRRKYGLLAEHLEPTSQPGGTRTVPSSKPPVRTDALSLAAKGGITGILGSWVQLLVEDNDVAPPNYRLGQEALVAAQTNTLKANLTWLLEQDFAPELVDEISQLRTDIQALFGDTERKWTSLPGRWDCPVIDPEHGLCGHRLRQRIGQWLVQCPSCESEWSGEAEFERLGLMLGCQLMVTVEQAAALMKVHRKTIERWVREYNLTLTLGQIDKRDLALLAARRAG